MKARMFLLAAITLGGCTPENGPLMRPGRGLSPLSRRVALRQPGPGGTRRDGLEPGRNGLPDGECQRRCGYRGGGRAGDRCGRIRVHAAHEPRGELLFGRVRRLPRAGVRRPWVGAVHGGVGTKRRLQPLPRAARARRRGGAHRGAVIRQEPAHLPRSWFVEEKAEPLRWQEARLSSIGTSEGEGDGPLVAGRPGDLGRLVLVAGVARRGSPPVAASRRASPRRSRPSRTAWEWSGRSRRAPGSPTRRARRLGRCRSRWRSARRGTCPSRWWTSRSATHHRGSVPEAEAPVAVSVRRIVRSQSMLCLSVLSVTEPSAVMTTVLDASVSVNLQPVSLTLVAVSVAQRRVVESGAHEPGRARRHGEGRPVGGAATFPTRRRPPVGESPSSVVVTLEKSTKLSAVDASGELLRASAPESCDCRACACVDEAATGEP